MKEDTTEVELKWPNYLQHLRKSLSDMFKSMESTADVTLVCEDGTETKAHKLVLSASSNFLNNAINDLPVNGKKIFLKGIQNQEIQSILEYMYLGVVKVNQAKMNELIEAAKILQVYDFEKVPSVMETVKKEKLPCKECSLKFYDNGTLNRHIQSKHEGLTFSCDQCDYQSSRKDTLSGHIQNKHLKLKLKCDGCDFVGKVRALRDHKKVVHKGQKFTCCYCDYQADSRHALVKHKMYNHDGIIKYDCGECDYQGTQERHLKNHMKKHEDTKYPCFKCSFQSTSKSELKYHYQLQHK